MRKQSPWKIGIGTGLILFGLYLVFNLKELAGNIIGFVAIAFGIGLIASN